MRQFHKPGDEKRMVVILPESDCDARLRAPAAQQPHYADHFCVSVSTEVAIEQWTAAFFASRAFRLERFLLNRFFPDKATDDAARALGVGHSDVFSAWTMERRSPGQLLLNFVGFVHEEVSGSPAGLTRLTQPETYSRKR